MQVGIKLPRVASNGGDQHGGGVRAHTFVGKVVDQFGNVSFHRVESPDTGQARDVLASVFGPSASVQIVSTGEFLLENDGDFARPFQASGASTLESFVQSLGIVEPTEVSTDISADQDSGSGLTDSNGGMPDDPAGLPVDVQSFPFASFQNAVKELGIDPEGVLGSTVARRFDALAPVARIGSLTGTIDPIGQDPGALEDFFREGFGDLGAAARTFSDLMAGGAVDGLDADQLLAFEELRSPNLDSTRGRAAAADVFRLARAAASNRFGPFVASRLLPSSARLFRELERQLAEGDTSTDFLEFARQQNLLPA